MAFALLGEGYVGSDYSRSRTTGIFIVLAALLDKLVAIMSYSRISHAPIPPVDAIGYGTGREPCAIRKGWRFGQTTECSSGFGRLADKPNWSMT
jgi:hypothetical protein